MSENTLCGSISEKNVLKILLLKEQNITKYGFYAKQAKKDGFEQIQAIYLETINHQTSHLKTLMRLLEGCQSESLINLSIPPIQNTQINISDSIATESQMIQLLDSTCITAWDEGLKKVHTKLKLFKQIAEFHQSRFEKIGSRLNENTVFERDTKVKWICRKCGLIYEGTKALHNCPGCEHPQAWFEVLAENW